MNPMNSVLIDLYIARSWLKEMHIEKETPENRIKAALAQVNQAIDTIHQTHNIECQKLREG